MSKKFRYLGQTAAFSLIYILTDQISLAFPSSGPLETLIFPATAVSIAILLIFGLRFWPSVLIGALISALIRDYSQQLAFGLSIALTLQTSMAAYLLNRSKAFKLSFVSAKTVQVFTSATLISVFIGATLGKMVIDLSPEASILDIGIIWSDWILIYGTSIFLITPPILIIYANRNIEWSTHQLVELLLVIGVVSILSALIFIELPNPAQFLPLTFIVIPLLIWIALRFTPRELTVSSLLASLIILGGIANSAANQVILSNLQNEKNLFLFFSFLAIVVLILLIISTITMYQQTQTLALAIKNDELVEGVQARTKELQIANEQLAQARDQAVEALKIKNQILANISHDARTPLNVIILYTELLKENIYGPLSEKQRDKLSTILASSHELLRFINNLLDETNLNSDQVSPQFEPIVVKEWLNERVNLFLPRAKRDELILNANISLNMPERVMGDPIWLNQIFDNLLDNAIKFTENGRIDIIVSANPNIDCWQLIVEDTGIGIEQANIQKIFDPFWQVDGSETRQANRGVGLGLSIVKQRLDILGGTIHVENKQTGGSIFTILIPFVHEWETSRVSS
ncbi:MAG: ATP-binding protein [Chloroflexota bacterium]